MWEQLIPTLPGKKAIYSEDGETFPITIKEAKIEPPGEGWGSAGAISFVVERGDGTVFSPCANRKYIGVHGNNSKLIIATTIPGMSWEMMLLD